MGLFPFLVYAVQHILVVRVILPFHNLNLALNYDPAPKLLCTRSLIGRLCLKMDLRQRLSFIFLFSMSEIKVFKTIIKQKSHSMWPLAQLIIIELGCLDICNRNMRKFEVKYNQMECSCKCTSCFGNKLYYFGLLAF